MAQTNELLRSLPSIAVLLEHNEVEEWLVGLPRSAVVEALRVAVDAARNARFVTRSFRAAGADRFEVIADLTIKGMSKEIVLPFTLTITDGVAHAVGEVTIQRTDFAIGSGIWSGERPVAYAVKIVVDITATPLP